MKFSMYIYVDIVSTCSDLLFLLYPVPADAQGSVQHVTLWNVAMDMLPKLWSWFSQVKQLECCEICPPQKVYSVCTCTV